MTGMRIIRAKRRDGSSFPALVSLARFIQDGRPAVAATAHDMTAIVTANDRLTQLSLELSDQLKAAQDASEAKSQFLAHMSHELRTPLNAVLGFADLIRWTGPSEIGNEKLSGYIDDIHRSGAQLLDLINDVLDLAKIAVVGDDFLSAEGVATRLGLGALPGIRGQAPRAGRTQCSARRASAEFVTSARRGDR